MGPASHPIRGEVVDVNGAMANFDAITYVKGQSVLHQLMAYIGEDAFVEGLRAYFRDHAFGNTVLDDLMYCVRRGRRPRPVRLDGRWLDRSGTDVLVRCDGDDRPRGVPRREAPRPHRINIASYAVDGQALRPSGRDRDGDHGTRTAGRAPGGDLRLVNADDHTFAAVRPDADVAASPCSTTSATSPSRSHARWSWAAIDSCCCSGELAPARRADGAQPRPPHRAQPRAGRAVPRVGHHVADRWAPADRVPGLRGRRSPTPPRCSPRRPGHRQPALRTLAATATTDAHWAVLEEAAGGRPTSTWPGGWPSAAPSSARATTTPSAACSSATPTPTPG